MESLVSRPRSRRALPALAAALVVIAGGACGAEQAPDPPARAATPAPATPAPEHANAPATRRRSRRAQAPVRSEGAARVEVIAAGLTVPWDIAFLPDGRALVTERPGRIRLVDTTGRLQSEPVADVPNQARGEGGLLGIAVDPEYAGGQPFVYLYVTTARGMQVQRWRMVGERLRSDGVVLGGIAAGSIHDSGRLRFGPDRRLYVATGDAGRRELAQNRRSLNGKFLRLEPRQYRASTSRPTVYSLGHRNPQGLDWQPGTGRLFATEHGPSGFDGPSGDDEINVIRRGGNYGWPLVRGTRHGRFIGPVHLYHRTVAPSGAAFVTRGGSSWTGNLLVAALKGTALHRLTVRGATVTGDQTLLSGTYGRLRAVTEAPDGSIWVSTSNRDSRGSPGSDDDRILRVVPPAG
jgi:glucose/arabinose dehydrogenase